MSAGGEGPCLQMRPCSVYQVSRITVSARALPMSTQPSMSLRRAVPEAWSRASGTGSEDLEIPPPEELPSCHRI